ncbi:hypothetical protein BUALT_Bualt18G0128000 [Buddleja alternifolia]|uniref:NB-ARC domain-containing protein n=1 Tax=Buddleja alternifolia TaxID=168488 RepID=A0AAV6W6C3_9LAMI|nr:hypothetical protein BUALT_Bualt18G0128000 [Buddleja alternifolia]
MAYAALVSLKTTIVRLLNSSRISIVPNPHIENLCNEVDSLLEFLKGNSSLEISSGGGDDLESKTIKAVYEIEDGLESQLVSHCESTGDAESYPLRFTIDLQKVDSFAETVKQIKEDLQKVGSCNDDDVPSRIDLGSSVLAHNSLISLMKKIEQPPYPYPHFPSKDSKIGYFFSISPKVELLYKVLASIQLLLERSTSTSEHLISRRSQKAIADLDTQITEATLEFSDLLDNIAHWARINNYYNVQRLEQTSDFFAKKLSKIKEEYNTQVLKLSKYSVEGDDIKVRIDFGRSEKERSEMAYAALISLMNKIENISDSESSIIVPRCPKIELVYKDLGSLQGLVERSSKRSQEVVANLDRQIKEATAKLEKALELYQTAASQLTSEDESRFLTALQGLEQEIDFFTTSVSKIKEEYTTMECSKIIGLHDEMNELKDRLISDAHHVVSIVGMVGIGKTTLARHVYEDPLILSHFQRRAWVTIGQKYQFEKIMSDLLDQLSPGIHDDDISGTWIQQDFNPLYNSLSFKRYLIVFDDIWESEVWHMFRRFLPGNSKGSKIVFTTRRDKVNSVGTRDRMQFSWSLYIHKMRFLNNEESWYMFCEKVFAENSCPPELEKASKKIVQNCEGLPLAIIILAKHLSKSKKTLKDWTDVAEKRIRVFGTADELEVIRSSYKYLSDLQYKACFLYTGVFPQDSKISVSKLFKLWRIEGLFEPNPKRNLEHTAFFCLEDLISNSLVMVRKLKSSGGTKTCGTHYIFQDLLHSEASKYKFFHVINRYDEDLTEAIKDHRRICIHNNVLFGIKDVHKSMVPISTTVRSVLCTGQHHQYPVPMFSGLSLLKVLDALTIRFYNFPFEILQLFRLRYLAFTYNGELPASISKLWDLQCLIVRKHLSIKHVGGAPSYLPMEIWEMKELKHLQVMGCDLPDPCGGSLPNLVTLLDVSFHSCTKGVLKGIPKLEKLGIQIEIPLDVVEPFYWPNDLRHLDKLDSLKLGLVIPGIIDGVSWLRVLKLRNYAFRGPEWKLFWRGPLHFLLIEDTNLEFLKGSFDNVTHLTLSHCYKLKDISAYWKNLKTMELVDCNPSAAEQAEMIRSARDFSLSVHFSGWCFRLLGFAIGIVQKDSVIDGRNISVEDVLYHPVEFIPMDFLLLEGFSTGVGCLRRTTFLDHLLRFGEALMAPTVIYVKQARSRSFVLDIISKGGVKGIAHVTGGGLTDNIPPVFPKGIGAVIYNDSWDVPPVVKWIQEVRSV